MRQMNQPWEQWTTVIGSDGMDYLLPDSQAIGYAKVLGMVLQNGSLACG
jgi:hypothetical protein